MKTRNNIMPDMLYFLTVALVATFCLNSTTTAKGLESEEVKFLQSIQNHLSRTNRMKDVTVHVFVEQKRKIHVKTSSIGLSYGFLKDMQNINQLVATLAHLTAFIKLGYVVTPPLPEDIKHDTGKTSFNNYIKSAIRPRYPDEGYMPEAKGTFQNDRSETITRPRYQNREYDYSFNKSDIITEERQLVVDKLTDKIMKQAGFCPQDYSRLLHYFYETPQTIPENKHFALKADQWQRIDTADQRADPATPCNAAQIALTQKYAGPFNQLKIKISNAEKTR